VSIVEDGDEPLVRLERWTGPWPDDDPDANLKADVAAYALADPLATVRRLARNLDVPVGALVRYVLARWASGGSEGLLELGPSTVERMGEVVRDAEEHDTDAARLDAYRVLAQMTGWLTAGLEDPETTYPGGGAGRRRFRRVSAYGVITRDDTGGEALLLCRIAEGWPGAGAWTLPGGGVDHGEHPEDAARREVEEETGLPPRIGELLAIDSLRLGPDESLKGDDFHALRLLYRATVPLDREPRHEQEESTDRAAWIPRDELHGLPTVELVDVALRELGWP
jgi:ADP-ribose pyrophosphatase YjhB (NUDIX family)